MTSKLLSEWRMSHGNQGFRVMLNNVMSCSKLGILRSCFGELVLWNLRWHVELAARYRLQRISSLHLHLKIIIYKIIELNLIKNQPLNSNRLNLINYNE